MNTELELYKKTFIENIKLLSLPLDIQRKILPDYVDPNEDVINGFFESFLLLPQLVENGYFSLVEIASILRLNNLITLLPNDYQQQDIDEVRKQAKNCLTVFGVETESPDLELIATWIKR